MEGRTVTGIGGDGNSRLHALGIERIALSRGWTEARTIFATDIRAETVASRAASKSRIARPITVQSKKRRSGWPYAGVAHGFTSATPMPSKSLMLRVTSVICRVKAVAAI